MGEIADKLAALAQRVEDGYAILFSGFGKDDRPEGVFTIHDVSHREGATLKVDREVRHCGFGFFAAYVPGGEEYDRKSEISFDAGGAMQRIGDYDQPYHVTYTPLRGTAKQLVRMGYQWEPAAAYLRKLQAIAEEMGV